MLNVNVGNMRIEDRLIAIFTCCCYDLVRLVDNRLQPWKHIKISQDITYIIFDNWMLSNGQIVGACNHPDREGMQFS